MTEKNETVAAGARKSSDPFNWPMPNRADLMSAKGLCADADMFHTRTQHFRQKQRQTSDNLMTSDIHGRYLTIMNCIDIVF